MLRPAPSLAQRTTNVEAHLLAVKRLYEDLENESALKQIAHAKTLPRTKNEDVTLSLYEGVIQADLSRWAESAAAFKAALSQQPEAQLPVQVSPKVQQHFEKVRQEVQQELAAHAKPPPPPAPPAPQPSPADEGTKQGPAVSQLQPEPQPESSADLPRPVGGLTTGPTEVTGRRFMRPQFLIPAMTGGVLLVAGGTTWAMSRQELSRLNNDDPAINTREEARQAASRGRTLQGTGVALLGAGALGLGIATGWYVFGAPSNELSLTVGTDGASAFVNGRWP
jgi:hypothetical protein